MWYKTVKEGWEEADGSLHCLQVSDTSTAHECKVLSLSEEIVPDSTRDGRPGLKGLWGWFRVRKMVQWARGTYRGVLKVVQAVVSQDEPASLPRLHPSACRGSRISGSESSLGRRGGGEQPWNPTGTMRVA